MGYKGRKARLKNFQQRADSFFRAMLKPLEKNSTRVNRDNRQILIGTGVNKRLIVKASPDHALIAKNCETKLISFLKTKNIIPRTYTLSPVILDSSGRVQEYFHKPSLAALVRYVSSKTWASHVSSEDYKLCKQFFGQKQNKGITFDVLEQTKKEYLGHFSAANLPAIWVQNIIVLGKLKDGRLRLAIVDI